MRYIHACRQNSINIRKNKPQNIISTQFLYCMVPLSVGQELLYRSKEPNPSIVGQEIENVILHPLNTVLPANDLQQSWRVPRKRHNDLLTVKKKPKTGTIPTHDIILIPNEVQMNYNFMLRSNQYCWGYLYKKQLSSLRE